MTKITDQQISELLQSDEDQLLEQLGMRSAVVSRDVTRSADFQLSVKAADIAAMGIKDDMKVLGGKIVRRWNRSAYELACGTDPDDSRSREDLQKALGIGEGAAIAALTAGLIGIGLMAALAPLIATIIVKKFFNPAYGEFCGYWKQKL
jgi:hypothetical protein